MKNLLSIHRILGKSGFWGVVCGLGLVQIALAQSAFQSAIGLPIPSIEGSPGGIPISNWITHSNEFVIPASNYKHPYSVPNEYDRSVVWLNNDGLITNSKLYNSTTTTPEYMAWIDTGYQNKLLLAGTDNGDMTLTMISQDGTPIWVRKTGTSNLIEKGVFVKVDDAGTALLLGSQETTAAQHSVVAVRADEAGNRLWGQVYTMDGWTMEASAVTTLSCPQLRYYITGTMTPLAGGTSRVFLLVIDGNGTPVQMNYYNISQYDGSDVGTNIQARCTPELNIWISGYSYRPSLSKYRIMLLKADALGNLEWGFNYDIENGDEFARHFIVNPSGELIVTGKAECHEFGGNYLGYCMLSSISADGLTVNWNRTFKWSSNYLRLSEGFRVERNLSNAFPGYFVTGTTELAGDKDILAILTDTEGQSPDLCYHDTSMEVISNGTTAYGTDLNSLHLTALEFFNNSILNTVAFLNNQVSCGEGVGTHDPNALAPAPLLIYPNPAKDRITLEWVGNTPKKGLVTIMTPSGSVVRALELNGTNQMDIELGSLPAGLYFLKVQSEDQWFKSIKVMIQ